MSSKSKDSGKPNTRHNTKHQHNCRTSDIEKKKKERFRSIHSPNNEPQNVFKEKHQEFCNQATGRIALDNINGRFDPEDSFDLNMIKARMLCYFTSGLITIFGLAEITRIERK